MKSSTPLTTYPLTPRIYQALALRSALKLMAQGIKPNRAYTPAAVLRTVSRLTGGTYTGRKDYDRAIADLTTWLENHNDTQS